MTTQGRPVEARANRLTLQLTAKRYKTITNCYERNRWCRLTEDVVSDSMSSVYSTVRSMWCTDDASRTFLSNFHQFNLIVITFLSINEYETKNWRWYQINLFIEILSRNTWKILIIAYNGWIWNLYIQETNCKLKFEQKYHFRINFPNLT